MFWRVPSSKILLQALLASDFRPFDTGIIIFLSNKKAPAGKNGTSEETSSAAVFASRCFYFTRLFAAPGITSFPFHRLHLPA